jgi:hypothetical protein
VRRLRRRGGGAARQQRAGGAAAGLIRQPRSMISFNRWHMNEDYGFAMLQDQLRRWPWYISKVQY